MSREEGRKYEKKACCFLKERKFEIIECNFYSRFGEIDIVAKKNGVLHFVEVKGSKKSNPVYAITSAKLSRIIQTIQFYLLKNSLDLPYCIDVVSICGDRIEYLENITL